MSIVRIDVVNVRNIRKASICPSEKINLFWGANGSGKSSFLEAIYLLASGKSFRTHQIQKVLTFGAETLIVFAECRTRHDHPVSLGIERGNGITRLRVNGNRASAVSRLAQQLPVQVINPDSHHLIEQGPRYRRHFIDWGMFHVEHGFFPIWSRFNLALRQRNAALRKGAEECEITVWHNEMSDCARRISEFRNAYICELVPLARQITNEFLGETELDIRFIPGWKIDEPYDRHLDRALKLDRNKGYTRHGPHRADLSISIGGVSAKDCLSRGEQKMLAIALRLSQIELLRKKNGLNCVLLVDDLPSELDSERRSKLIDRVVDLNCQVFITATERELLSNKMDLIDKVFHVEHGDIKEMI